MPIKKSNAKEREPMQRNSSKKGQQTATLVASVLIAAAPMAGAQRSSPADPPAERAATIVVQPAPPTRITINGKVVSADQNPLLVRTAGDLSPQILVPIRFVVESLRATVYWDPEAQTAVVLRGRNNIALRVGEDIHTVNGIAMTTRAPVRLVGGRTMVPIRFVSDALGATVTWDGPTRTVAITLPTPPAATGAAETAAKTSHVPARP
jgi:hypothetical protein